MGISYKYIVLDRAIKVREREREVYRQKESINKMASGVATYTRRRVAQQKHFFFFSHFDRFVLYVKRFRFLSGDREFFFSCRYTLPTMSCYIANDESFIGPHLFDGTL